MSESGPQPYKYANNGMRIIPPEQEDRVIALTLACATYEDNSTSSFQNDTTRQLLARANKFLLYIQEGIIE